MGVGGISIWQLMIILVIVILLFGTKRLRSLGTDLGASLRSFKQAMKEGESDSELVADEPATSRLSTDDAAADEKAADPATAPEETKS